MKLKILLLSIFIGVSLSAQDKVLSIYYISHSETTNVRALLASLKLARPMDDSESAIFYLANSDRPMVSYVNLPYDGVPFNLLITEISSKSAHEVYPEVDIRKLCDIFDKVDQIRGQYAFVNLHYYIDSLFWEFYRNSVIAKMYYALDLSENPDYLTMNIYFTDGDQLNSEDEKNPFGAKNLCEGYEFMPLTLYE